MKKIACLFFSICCFLFTANNLSAQCCNFSYQQQVEPSTSAATFGVALGDFDNDGDKDAVAISAYYGIDVYFNNGSGTFTLNAQYAVGGGDDFYGVHVCDIDGDTDLDIIAIPFYTSTNLTFLKNNGSGVFTVSSVSSNIATYNADVGDIDGDGDVDVFLPNASGGSGKIFKNNGSGVFSLFQTLAGARGNDAALADLDGDGDLDAFVSENGSYGNSVFTNNGAGTFTQYGATFSNEGGVVALGDLDGDGDIDAWVGTAGNTSNIFLNNGSAVFSAGPVVTTHPTWGYCKAVNLFDYDSDGDLDVFLGFYSHKPQVWTNTGGLTFSLCYEATVGSGSHGQAIGDLNNDGNTDIYSGYFSNDDGDYVFLSNFISASILYKNSPYCNNISTPQDVTQSGATGGTYSASPAGLSINSADGSIVPSTSTPGTYTVTYTVSGCSFTTSVTISSIDLGTSVNGSTITANQGGALYNWIDCNNANQLITGEISQSYTPAINGSYAAIIVKNGCLDTTTCVNILTVGITENSLVNKLKIYPNPVSDELCIETEATSETIEFEIYSSTGHMVINGNFSGKTRVRTAVLSSGIFFVKLKSINFIEFRKFIKK